MKIKTVGRLLIVGILAISFICPLCFGAFAASEVTPAISIGGHNLSFSDNVYLIYYVKPENLPSGAETGVLIWTNSRESYLYGTQDYILSASGTQTISNVEYQKYHFKELSAKKMTDDVYAVAYIKNGSDIIYSNLDKYSILRYAYNKLGKTGTATTDDKLIRLINGMLEYGKLAQQYFDYKTDTLATDNYSLVEVTGGTLSDGTTTGLFKVGSVIAISTSDKEFRCWEDDTGLEIGSTKEINFTVPGGNSKIKAISEPVSTEPQFVVQSVTTTPGSDGVLVNIAVKNNPGIASIVMNVSFDNTALTLTEITYNSSIGGQSVMPQKMSSPVKLYWVNGFSNTDGDWTFATLKFNVATEATVGEYDIGISYNGDDVYNLAENNIDFEVVNGKIVVQ